MQPEQIIDAQRKHVFYTWTAQNNVKEPIVIERAKGVYFWDKKGKRYLDFSSQMVNMNIGHGHPKVIKAIQDQAAQLAFAHPGAAVEPRAAAGAKLAEVTPGDLNKTLFTLGGAEAVENAIKMARQYTGRHKIITRYRSYHGASFGALTATGDPRRFAHEPGITGIVRVHDPYAYRCPFGYAPKGNPQVYIDHVIQTIEFEGPENVAAILMEPITGYNGVIIPPENYWRALRTYADKHGILLICDEVLTGFGRTGYWFAIEQYGVIPDIMVLAKGLTCGYVPLGAVTVRQPIADYFDDHPLHCGLTFSGHPIGCAAAYATLKVYEEEALIENSQMMGKYLEEQLMVLQTKHPCMGDIRGCGLYSVIECVKNRATREPMAPWNAKPQEMGVMAKAAGKFKQLGMHTFLRWNWIFIAPPLCITKEELDEGLAIIDEVLHLIDTAYEG